MKKTIKGFTFLLVALIILYFVGRVTGMFRVYSIPVLAMEPTLKTGSKIFVTNLKKAKPLDLVAYRRIINEKDGYGQIGKRAHFVHRVIAFSGDTVKIINGYAFVNGKTVDDSAKLKFNYSINESYRDEMLSILNTNQIALTEPPYCENGSCIAALTYEQFKKVRSIIKIVRDTTKLEYSDILYKEKNQAWTIDNYGPFVVPEKHFFVLGDNRHYSADSRFHGPIAIKDLLGVVLWKK